MKQHLASAMVLTSCTALAAFSGCGSEVDPPGVDEATAAQSDALLYTEMPHYFTARRDLRRCAAPRCGGYFVREVNTPQREGYVSGLDFTSADLDDGAIRAVEQAPDGELVLRGALGHVDPRSGVRSFRVAGAYRGMPGITAAPGDGFYVVRDRVPAIVCIRAPCDDETAYRLNTPFVHDFASISIEHAAAPYVDQAWLTDRVEHHGAVVTAHLGAALQSLAGDDGHVLDVSQVFVRLPDRGGPCLLQHHVCRHPLVPTYTRDVDRCLVFDRCRGPDACLPAVPPRCAGGYTLAEWPNDGRGCLAYACDPAFLAQ